MSAKESNWELLRNGILGRTSGTYNGIRIGKNDVMYVREVKEVKTSDKFLNRLKKV